MGVYVVVAPVAFGRELCNRIENTELSICGAGSSVHVYHALRKLYSITSEFDVYSLSDFMEAFNDTDDDQEIIDVKDFFISYLNVKWVSS